MRVEGTGDFLFSAGVLQRYGGWLVGIKHCKVALSDDEKGNFERAGSIIHRLCHILQPPFVILQQFDAGYVYSTHDF